MCLWFLGVSYIDLHAFQPYYITRLRRNESFWKKWWYCFISLIRETLVFTLVCVYYSLECLTYMCSWLIASVDCDRMWHSEEHIFVMFYLFNKGNLSVYPSVCLYESLECLTYMCSWLIASVDCDRMCHSEEQIFVLLFYLFDKSNLSVYSIKDSSDI